VLPCLLNVQIRFALIQTFDQVAALVFTNLGAKQFANPQFGFDGYVTEGRVYSDVEEFFTKLKDALGKHYPNAIIPTLFKNLSKCKHLYTVAA
jgi:hypothetical protein